MSNDTIEFISGLSFKAPHERAPEFVKAKGSIKVADLRAWLDTKKESEWVNFDLKVSKGGKWIATVDNWKPDGAASRPASTSSRQAPPAADFDDDIGF